MLFTEFLKNGVSNSCHTLKHEENGAQELLNEFIGYRQKMNKCSEKRKTGKCYYIF